MGQQPTQGPPPKGARKQPAPLKTGAWEWFTTGYFDESPEENGITVALNGVSSWVGKIQGIEYAQSNGGFRPIFVNDQARGFRCPSIYIAAGAFEDLNWDHQGSLNFMHDGTGGTIFIIAASDVQQGGQQNIWTSGNHTGTDTVGFELQYTSNDKLRVIISNSSSVNLTSQAQQTFVERHNLDAQGIGCSYSTAAGVTLFTDAGDLSNVAESNSPSASNTTYISRIGQQGNGGNGFAGHITDIIIWDRVITESERDEITAWARHKLKGEPVAAPAT